MRNYRRFDEFDDEGIQTAEPSKQAALSEEGTRDHLDEADLEVRKLMDGHFNDIKQTLQEEFQGDPRIELLCEKIKESTLWVVERMNEITAKVDKFVEESKRQQEEIKVMREIIEEEFERV